MKKEVSTEDIINFVEGNLNYLRSLSNFFKLDYHIREQAIYRSYLCRDCLDAGYCKICNCMTPHMFYSPRKVDSDNKWSAMLTKDQWETFKKDNNIDMMAIEAELGDMASREIRSEFSKENIDDANKTRLAKELVKLVNDVKDKEIK